MLPASSCRERPPRSAFENLTTAERRVAALLAQGLSNKEIAQALDLAEATIKNHVASIYRRTGLHSRARFIASVANLRPPP